MSAQLKPVLANTTRLNERCCYCSGELAPSHLTLIDVDGLERRAHYGCHAGAETDAIDPYPELVLDRPIG